MPIENVEAGTVYSGEHNSRRAVKSVEGDIVTYVLPMSLREATCTVAEFEAWADGEYEAPGA